MTVNVKPSKFKIEPLFIVNVAMLRLLSKTGLLLTLAIITTEPAEGTPEGDQFVESAQLVDEAPDHV